MRRAGHINEDWPTLFFKCRQNRFLVASGNFESLDDDLADAQLEAQDPHGRQQSIGILV